MDRVRLRDVAAAAGVSQGTASNVYNRPEVVRPALRQRVLDAAASLGFTGPAPTARALRQGRANLIAVVSDESLGYMLADPYGRRLLGGVAVVCDAQGVGLTVASTHGSGGAPGQGWSIDSALVDGFILYCYEDDAEVAARARLRGLPMVAIDVGRMAGVATIGIDERKAARAAAAHVAGLGHRQVAILSLELSGDRRTGSVGPARIAAARYGGTRDRLEGYLGALAAAGIAAETVAIHETLNDAPTTHAALDAMAGNPGFPTAILAMSDVMALHAMDWLAARGLRVPGDVSVVGFDDTPEGAQATPALTTLAQPADLKGRIAAEMLLGLRPMGDHVLPTALTVRGSTAAPPR